VGLLPGRQLANPLAAQSKDGIGQRASERNSMWRRDARRLTSRAQRPRYRAPALGSLDNVTRIVRLGAASELFESMFGKEKTSVLDNE
jgi:hypothetical protein